MAVASAGRGRPRTADEMEALVVRMANENRDWGTRRIQGALSNLGHHIAGSTIAAILQRQRHRASTGTHPEDDLERNSSLGIGDMIVAADFFTVEVWTLRGLQRMVVLFFIEVSTRKVQVAGIATDANGLWMGQIGRNMTDTVDGMLSGKRYLIHDRDPLFTTEFLNMLAEVGVKSVKLPPRSPNLNAYAERFVRSIKESCLDRLILLVRAPCERGFRNLFSIIITSATTRVSATD